MKQSPESARKNPETGVGRRQGELAAPGRLTAVEEQRWKDYMGCLQWDWRHPHQPPSQDTSKISVSCKVKGANFYYPFLLFTVLFSPCHHLLSVFLPYHLSCFMNCWASFQCMHCGLPGWLFWLPQVTRLINQWRSSLQGQPGSGFWKNLPITSWHRAISIHVPCVSRYRWGEIKREPEWASPKWMHSTFGAFFHCTVQETGLTAPSVCVLEREHVIYSRQLPLLGICPSAPC